MPQDIRVSPDGKRYYIADMDADGVHIVDAARSPKVGFIRPAWRARPVPEPRRHQAVCGQPRHAQDPRQAERQGQRDGDRLRHRKSGGALADPGGGSPDMGNVSADGKYLWLSGRFDDVVYRIDTSNGDVKKIKVGQEPHGLTVWPQPGRYSLGHTGNMR
jgi:DNA-binding beta-propeller fold protein YncE